MVPSVLRDNLIPRYVVKSPSRLKAYPCPCSSPSTFCNVFSSFARKIESSTYKTMMQSWRTNRYLHLVVVSQSKTVLLSTSFHPLLLPPAAIRTRLSAFLCIRVETKIIISPKISPRAHGHTPIPIPKTPITRAVTHPVQQRQITHLTPQQTKRQLEHNTNHVA